MIHLVFFFVSKFLEIFTNLLEDIVLRNIYVNFDQFNVSLLNTSCSFIKKTDS